MSLLMVVGSAWSIQQVVTKRNRNNRARGKHYEKRTAEALGGWRNLDKSRPHTDVETDTEVYEIKSTQASIPRWMDKAFSQLELASKESKKIKGGVIRVHTEPGKGARAFLIQEILI